MLFVSHRLPVVSCVFLLAVCAALTSAQTTVYFTAQTTGSYPATCTSGALSCTANATSGGYVCNGGTVSGTHYYYPSATSVTFNSSLLTGTTPTLCEQYYADFQLPLTTGGVNVQYGTTAQPVCVNYRLRNTTGGYVPWVDPDAVDRSMYFNYSTTQSAVPACPTPVQPSVTPSAATVYFTYLGLNGTNSAAAIICGSGSLSCTSYGNNQYYCPTLNSGTHYQYSNTSGTYTATALTQEVECNGFGDGYLPLDYEGISFGGAFSSTFGCISWYGYSSGAQQGYDFYSTGSVTSYTSYGGRQSFTYSSTGTTAAAACSAYIPGLAANSNATYFSSSSSTGGAASNSTGAAPATAHFSAAALLFATALTALAMLLL